MSTNSEYLSYRGIFEDGELQEFIAASPNHRRRLYPPDTTLIAAVSQKLTQGSTQNAVDQIYVDRAMSGLPTCSLNNSSYVRAKGRLSLDAVKQTTKVIASTVTSEAQRPWRWKQRPVKFVDGTTVNMSDSSANQQLFPQHATQKPGCGYPLSRVCLISSLESGMIHDFVMSSWKGKGSGEISLASKLLRSVAPRDVLAADSLYLNYSFIAKVRERKADFVTLMKRRKKLVIVSRRKINANDSIIWVKKPDRRQNRKSWVSDEEYGRLPPLMKLRMTTIIVKRNGFRPKKLTLISTLVFTDQYSAEDIADLFYKRWSIETDLRYLKKDLGMDFINAKTPQMVEKECWISILAFNLLRRFINQSSQRFKIPPRQISFKKGIERMRKLLTQARSGMNRYYLKENILLALAKSRLKEQPFRFEPRAVKMKKGVNDYPKMSIPRKTWKMLQIWPYLEDLGFRKPVSEEIQKLMGFMITSMPSKKGRGSEPLIPYPDWISS